MLNTTDLWWFGGWFMALFYPHQRLQKCFRHFARRFTVLQIRMILGGCKTHFAGCTPVCSTDVCINMEVSWNGGTPKSSILRGFSLINYKPSIWGTSIDGTPHICFCLQALVKPCWGLIPISQIVQLHLREGRELPCPGTPEMDQCISIRIGGLTN